LLRLVRELSDRGKVFELLHVIVLHQL
jgi:hypothetical protein